MNHIVLGRDDVQPAGLILGLIGIAAVAAACFAAHWLSWNQPHAVQSAAKHTYGAALIRWLDALTPKAEYRREDISSHFWPNADLPTSAEWKALEASGFKEYRLRVYGLVDHSVEPSPFICSARVIPAGSTTTRTR